MDKKQSIDPAGSPAQNRKSPSHEAIARRPDIVEVAPRVTVPDRSLIESLASLIRPLDTFARNSISRPSRVIGLEARLAYYLIEERRSEAPRPLLLRPSIEPILLSYWPRAREWDFTVEDITSLHNCLYGQRLGLRDQEAVSKATPNGLRALFPSPEQVRDWRFNEAPTKDDDLVGTLRSALVTMSSIALTHPFADGNGRLSRAMFQASFARARHWPAPVLPLGPGSYLHSQSIVEAYRTLGTTADWKPLIAVIATIVAEAVDLVMSDLTH